MHTFKVNVAKLCEICRSFSVDVEICCSLSVDDHKFINRSISYLILCSLELDRVLEQRRKL